MLGRRRGERRRAAWAARGSPATMLPSSTGSRSSTYACSSRRSTSPSWRPVLPQRRVEQLLLRLPVKLLLAAVAITSDSVGAITSLSPPHGDERNGQVPWREGHLGLAGRAEGPHKRALPC